VAAYALTRASLHAGAREWIEAHAAEHPALAAVLADGAVQEQARKVTMLWKRANEQRVVQLRRTVGIRTQMNASHVHRTLTGIMHAFTRKHETFATFLSEPLDGLQRWQSALCMRAMQFRASLVVRSPQLAGTRRQQLTRTCSPTACSARSVYDYHHTNHLAGKCPCVRVIRALAC
jgi:hypothetical protein